MGYTFGIGNSFFDNAGINTFLIDKGYFPMSDNNFENGANSMYAGFEIMEKNSSQYCRVLIQKNLLTGNANNKSYVNYMGLSFDVFNDFCKNENWILASMIGVSVFDFYMSAVSANTTSDLTQSNLQESFYKKDVFCLKPGVEIKRKFQIGSLLLGVGLNCYYQFELGNGRWGNFKGDQYDNFAASKISGFVYFINSNVYF